MNRMKLISILCAFTVSACSSPTKTAEDTGFDLGITDDGSADADSDPENAAPEVSISSPNNGDVVDNTEPLEFFAVVSDDADDASLLELSWTSDRHGEFSDSSADSSGAATATTEDLEAGTHIITLTAIDRDGSSSSDTVTIRLDGEGNADADGGVLEDIDEDGFTVEEGDCNDEDPLTYPDAEEKCDGEDNNCDGIWDTEYYDAYEPNEHMGSAYDLGEIDGDWFDWGTESLTVTELNFDGPEDEDWFQWFADDDPGDDPDIAIYIEGDPGMYLIAELYLEEWDTTTPMAISEGEGSLTIDEADFEFEGDWWWSDFAWDTIYVRVRTDPDLWDESICLDSTYNLTIES